MHHARRISPNMITYARICLIPAFVAILSLRDHISGGTWIAFVLFAAMAASDFLDGYLARARGHVTTMGVFLDPLADKLLITAALVVLVQLRALQAWIAVLIIAREFAVTGLRLVASAKGEVIAANFLGKSKTVAQIALVLTLIPAGSPHWLRLVFIVLALVLTIGSGVEYFWAGRAHLHS